MLKPVPPFEVNLPCHQLRTSSFVIVAGLQHQQSPTWKFTKYTNHEVPNTHVIQKLLLLPLPNSHFLSIPIILLTTMHQLGRTQPSVPYHKISSKYVSTPLNLKCEGIACQYDLIYHEAWNFNQGPLQFYFHGLSPSTISLSMIFFYFF